MGLQSAPAFISGSGTFQHPVELMRNLVEGLAAGGSKGLLTPTSFALTPSGSAMQMTIGAGMAIISGAESTTQGAYFAWSNASETIAWPARPGSNSRWDTLLLRVIDSQYGSDPSADGAYWEVVQGAVAASPSKLLDSDFNTGGTYHRPGAWYRVADVLVESTDTNMSLTTIVNMTGMVNPYHARGEVGYSLQQVLYYTSSGTFVKANYPQARKVRVKAVGGGGGGGGSGTASASQSTTAGGGGGGGYAESLLDVAGLSSSVTVTVGGAGTAGATAPGGTGGTGGTSSFGTAVVATGGAGGTASTTSGSNATAVGQQGGAAGAGTSGDIQLTGTVGETGWKDTSLAYGGNGGNSGLGYGGGGQGGRIGSAAADAGHAGGNYGGGGGGSCAGNTATGLAGGAGAPGVVIVEVYG